MHQEEIIYKIAEESEIDEIFNMYRLAIQKMYEIGIDQWDEQYPDRQILTEDINKKELIVGKIKDKICLAYVINRDYDDEYKTCNWEYADSKFCIIHRFCVNPDFQNRGLARQTIPHIEKVCKKNGFETIRLDSFTKNPYATKLYDKSGYNIVGHAHWRKGKFDLREKKL